MEIAVPVPEAARRAGVGRSSLYEAINRGELPLRKAGRRSLVRVDDLKAWVDALPVANPHKIAA
ncbi:helix-turn-helix domain-containing protein [Aestuariivirga sp.]|uniref:helix-turn-helix domain-containing protein n=1 Tax=Aestuariivirga sp. TaxID=2650926 RepID=UPI0039E546C3